MVVVSLDRWYGINTFPPRSLHLPTHPFPPMSPYIAMCVGMGHWAATKQLAATFFLPILPRSQ